MNIRFNFATKKTIDVATDNQELALMPAELAQKLLRIYTRNLQTARASDIINNLIGDLRTCAEKQDIGLAVNTAFSWIAERELINNIKEENWDAYKVQGETSPISGRIVID